VLQWDTLTRVGEYTNPLGTQELLTFRIEKHQKSEFSRRKVKRLIDGSAEIFATAERVVHKLNHEGRGKGKLEGDNDARTTFLETFSTRFSTLCLDSSIKDLKWS